MLRLMWSQKEANEREDKIIEDAKANEEKILIELIVVKDALDHLKYSTLMFTLGDNDVSPVLISADLT